MTLTTAEEQLCKKTLSVGMERIQHQSLEIKILKGVFGEQ
jgi:hypothetical protein